MSHLKDFLLHQMLEMSDAMKRKPSSWPAKRPRKVGVLAADSELNRVVSDVIERRNAGVSFGRIAQDLNKKGVPAEKGGRWYGATVHYLIQRAGQKSS